ncbi:MAG: hypothetical protein MZV65_18705 [Chromatiales bacterium]|nr:hypothetical protein [Chromatiales bacterium]
MIRLLWSVLRWSRGDAEDVRMDKLVAFCEHLRPRRRREGAAAALRRCSPCRPRPAFPRRG